MHALASLAVLMVVAAVGRAGHPNVVVFLVDDLGWQDTSVPFLETKTPQNHHFHTPHLERLAAQGVRFTQAHACTVCSPTRCSLMTGWNAARHRVTNWIFRSDQETSGVTDRLRAPTDWRREGLPADTVTLPRLLRDRLGYRTIHVGKAHFGAVGTATSDPKALGFDINIAGHSAGSPGHYHGQLNYDRALSEGAASLWAVPDLEAYHGTAIHLTDALTVEANRAVAQAVADGKTFFLYLAHYAVHLPIQPHEAYLDRYRARMYPGTEVPIPETEVNYASMVEGIDASLGAVLQQLEELGVADETLVVFLADNGGLSRHARDTGPQGTGRDTHNWPLREGKGSAYEGGTRIPLVVAWAKPDAANAQQQALGMPSIPSGKTIATPMIVEDLAPTVLTWAGGSQYCAELANCDGIDLTPALHDEVEFAESVRQRAFVFHYPHQWHSSIEGGYQPHSAIRQGDWKAIYFYEGQRWELYDLKADIGEAQDQAAEYPDVLQRLATTLQSELERLGALWPVNRYTGQPEPLRRPDEIPFPGKHWSVIAPEDAGMRRDALMQVAEYLGGRGMVTFEGREVFRWGAVDRPEDVASAVKPIFTHLLIEAIEQGKLPGFEALLVDYEPGLGTLNSSLGFKDRLITFRHCANQISCYGVSESPGEAFDYNDFQMALFVDALIKRVFQCEWGDVDRELLGPLLTDVIGCEDRPSLLAFGDDDRAGRLRISPRDFCRLGLMYMHEGSWRGKPVIAPALARSVTHSPLPVGLQRTQAQPAEMIVGQRTLGSRQVPDDQTDHLGCYSWLWWVNGVRSSGIRLWPDAPDEVYACLGHRHGKRGMAVIPAWRIVLSWNDSKLDEYPWRNASQDPHPLNEVFRLLRPEGAAPP
jgi:arylsulfatase A-like enzyme